MSKHIFYLGDVREMLKKIPSKSVQCVVTSPPYWGLRDYGVDGQLGLETTPAEYVANLVEVFREVKRVLRDDGTLWLNLGDSYSGNCSQASNNGRAGFGNARERLVNRKGEGLKPKDLVGIPWMVAFALRDDGWYLRSDIIWAKPNSMPESVTDRPTKSHEYIFLLTKSARYYYDAEAIRESNQDKYNGKRGDTMTRKKMQSAMRSLSDKESMKRYSTHGRNKRTVWTVSTQPFPEAHFATFPPDLIEPCILAGTSPKACEVCGSPWERVIEKTGHINKREPAHVPGNSPTKTDSTGWMPTTKATNKWQPTCTCDNKGSANCIVLDPFGGAGTTTLVAMKHGRDSIYIDLSEEYLQIALKRLGFTEKKLFDVHEWEICS